MTKSSHMQKIDVSVGVNSGYDCSPKANKTKQKIITSCLNRNTVLIV